MSPIQDTQERKQAIQQRAQRLAGFSRPRLASYLGIPPNPSDPLLSLVYPMLALGKGIEVFPLAGSEGGACLVHGPRHFLVKGRGSRTAFTEEAARLAFFLKPPFAPLATLQCEVQVRPQGRDDARCEPRSVCLERHDDYTYSLNGHLASLVSSDWQHVQLLAGPWEALIPAAAFWDLVLDAGELPPGELFRCQIGIEHAARLVGRATLTLKRHLDGGLPRVGYSMEYPGFSRQNIEEFLAYTQKFPQGLISARQRQRWQDWRQDWRLTYQQRVAELVGASARLLAPLDNAG